MPTATGLACQVVKHIPSSGAPMQSAAKVPILVAFKVEQDREAPLEPLPRTLACIFKVGDDVRQDVLALQVGGRGGGGEGGRGVLCVCVEVKWGGRSLFMRVCVWGGEGHGKGQRGAGLCVCVGGSGVAAVLVLRWAAQAAVAFGLPAPVAWLATCSAVACRAVLLGWLHAALWHACVLCCAVLYCTSPAALCCVVRAAVCSCAKPCCVVHAI